MSSSSFPIFFNAPSGKPSDLGESTPARPTFIEFPKTPFGIKKTMRSFTQSMYTFNWVEYSISRDAIFCFCCRHYGGTGVFVTEGFRDWKTALEKGRGLYQHDQGKSHMDCCKMWREAMHRAKTGTTISYQLNTQQIDNNRYYIKAVAQIVQFLATNELAFRGSDEAVEGSEGIFLSLPWKRMSACKLFQQLFLTMPSTPALKSKMKSLMFSPRWLWRKLLGGLEERSSTRWWNRQAKSEESGNWDSLCP